MYLGSNRRDLEATTGCHSTWRHGAVHLEELAVANVARLVHHRDAKQSDVQIERAASDRSTHVATSLDAVRSMLFTVTNPLPHVLNGTDSADTDANAHASPNTSTSIAEVFMICSGKVREVGVDVAVAVWVRVEIEV